MTQLTEKIDAIIDRNRDRLQEMRRIETRDARPSEKNAMSFAITRSIESSLRRLELIKDAAQYNRTTLQ